jgi:pimeloyl-ACP methyl ester carboxylesterase
LLAEGAVADGFPPVREPTVLGVGQSMGGCFTIVQQGHHATYDAVAILGWSAIQTVLWMPPGTPDRGTVYIPRGSRAMLTTPSEGPETAFFAPDDSGLPTITPGFHHDDVPTEVVERDMHDYPTRDGDLPHWGSATIPACAMSLLAPGVVAPEAAVIGVPVLIAMGERDVAPNPRDEPRAYPRSPDVTVVVIPRMAHMHNMASTREQLWQRLQSWGDGVAAAR